MIVERKAEAGDSAEQIENQRPFGHVGQYGTGREHALDYSLLEVLFEIGKVICLQHIWVNVGKFAKSDNHHVFALLIRFLFLINYRD